ncbi:MAG: hypothetical protein IJP33_05245 [Firmicutes bacterium]|nr:hypothetical protein [Bacillota bacterium]
MKKRFILCLLLVALLVAAALPVGAVVKGVEIFEEYGTTYAWVIGEPVMPDDPPEDHHWEAVMDAEGFQVTEVGQCEYYGKNHVHSWDCWDPVTYEEICGMVAHSCNINCITDNIKYKYVLVEDKKEPVLLIVGRGPEGEAVLDCEYVLLKQEVKTDQYGQYVLDLEGNLQWSTERVSQDAKLNENGVAALLLDKKKLDQTADYAKLIVGQVLKGDAAETYRPLAKRWQVTVRKNAQGKYELYSITEAPGVNPKKPEDLPQDYFALGQPGFETVADYFNEATKTLTVVNEYYLGTIGLNIEFEGFGSVVPNEAAGAVSIVDGPTVFGEKFTKDTTLKNVHMGTYHVVADPVEVPGYGLEDIRIQVQAPVEAPPVDYGDALVLSKNSANAVVTVCRRKI